MSKEMSDDQHDASDKPAGHGVDGARDKFVRWMSGSGERPPSVAGEASMASLLAGSDDPAAAGVCEFVLAALAEYAELSAETAKSRMPQVADHLQSCAACREELALLREALSTHGAWVKLAAAMGGAEPGGFVVAIANAWHWLTGGQQAPVRLRQEDFTLGRGLGDWTLLPPRAEALSLSRGQGVLSPLALTLELSRGARVNVIITPEHLASNHREMWRLYFELAAGSSIKRVQLDLTDAKNRSRGMRTLRPGKTVEYQVAPPVDGCYSVTLVWSDGTGPEKECVLRLPVRAAQTRKDG